MHSKIRPRDSGKYMNNLDLRLENSVRILLVGINEHGRWARHLSVSIYEGHPFVQYPNIFLRLL